MSAPRTPVIGICSYYEPARWAVWSGLAALVGEDYLRAVRGAGALALLVPPEAILIERPELALDRLDGLMLIGGADVDPACYGAERDPLTEAPMPERDAVELALARAAWERGLPLLGICRGMQVINVVGGGTLEQHLPARLGVDRHRRHVGTFVGNEHGVTLEPGSLAAAAAGEVVHVVRSHHHQGVAALGAGLRITGRGDADDLPEAIEAPDVPYLLGVQWHPEADVGSRIIASVVAAARGEPLSRSSPPPLRATAAQRP